MSNTALITLEQLFRFWRALPHQQAAIGELEADLRENGYAVAMKRDRAWFSTWSQAGKQEDDAWLAPALEIIKRWEGCKLTAYPDPGTGGEPWTIGYGITQIGGQPVRPGQKISQAEADSLLEAEVRAKGQQVLGLLPMAAQWRPNQVAAIVSFTFNVGAGALERSTLRRRLLAGEDPAVVVAAELPRWNRAGDKVMEGLVRRRADEVKLFGTPKLDLPAQQPAGRPHLRLTRTGRVSRQGLELLELAYHHGSQKIASIDVVSGAPGAQRFRTGAQSKAGSLEPLPEGRWGIEDIAWAKGRDNYNASWGPGLGPVSIPLRYLGPGSTARSAIEIHIDSNARTSPGTAGCIGVAGEADYRQLVSWLRETDPRDLFVDWRLGTCPQPPG